MGAIVFISLLRSTYARRAKLGVRHGFQYHPRALRTPLQVACVCSFGAAAPSIGGGDGEMSCGGYTCVVGSACISSMCTCLVNATSVSSCSCSEEECYQPLPSACGTMTCCVSTSGFCAWIPISNNGTPSTLVMSSSSQNIGVLLSVAGALAVSVGVVVGLTVVYLKRPPPRTSRGTGSATVSASVTNSTIGQSSVASKTTAAVSVTSSTAAAASNLSQDSSDKPITTAAPDGRAAAALSTTTASSKASQASNDSKKSAASSSMSTRTAAAAVAGQSDRRADGGDVASTTASAACEKPASAKSPVDGKATGRKRKLKKSSQKTQTALGSGRC